MKKLISLLPLTFALCGCSAFVPVVLEDYSTKESGGLNLTSQPKGALSSNTLSSVYGEYYFHAEALDGGSPNQSYYQTPLGDSNSHFTLDDSGDDQYFFVPSQTYPDLVIIFNNADVTPSLGECYFYFSWYFDTENLRDDFYNYLNTQGAITWDNLPDWHDNGGKGSDVEGYFVKMTIVVQITQSEDIWFHLNDISSPTYSVSVTKNYCSSLVGTGLNQLPQSPYSEVANPYKIGFQTNTGSNLGYYFKKDGSSVSVTGGIEIISLEYGLTPTYADDLPFSDYLIITLNLPLAECSISVTAQMLETSDLQSIYDVGYIDGMNAGGAKPVEWIKNIFDGMASFFSVEIIPHLSLGLIMFAPLIVLAIIVIVRIFKHGG